MREGRMTCPVTTHGACPALRGTRRYRKSRRTAKRFWSRRTVSALLRKRELPRGAQRPDGGEGGATDQAVSGRDAVHDAQSLQDVLYAPERVFRVGSHHEEVDLFLALVVALKLDGIAQSR